MFRFKLFQLKPLHFAIPFHFAMVSTKSFSVSCLLTLHFAIFSLRYATRGPRRPQVAEIVREMGRTRPKLLKSLTIPEKVHFISNFNNLEKEGLHPLATHQKLDGVNTLTQKIERIFFDK